MNPASPEKNTLPPSCVGWWDSAIGFVVMMAVFFGLRFNPRIGDVELCLAMIMGLSFVLGVIEITRAPWRKIPPSEQPLGAILRRAGIKWLGFLASLALIGFLYWMFPEYRRPYYREYFDAVTLVAPFLPPLFLAYYLFAEWRFPEEHDGCWQMAMFTLGRWHAVDWEKFRQHILGWLIKGYFLAIMFGDLAMGLPRFRYAMWNFPTVSFIRIYSDLFVAAVTLELVFVTAGYAFSSRLFNSQLRTAEDTLFGWFMALMCYGPFLSIFFVNYFGYREDGTQWRTWLSGHPVLYVLWGSVILISLAIHMWCDACFGLRFSNLTNRGIITNGCYRFCKHPAYIMKNIRWWLVSVPFAAGGIEGLRMTLLILGVNIIYTVRCYAEEKLLSRDPTYVAYGLWMDKHGIFRWVGKALPFLTYESRLRRWRERGLLKPLTYPEYQ